MSEIFRQVHEKVQRSCTIGPSFPHAYIVKGILQCFAIDTGWYPGHLHMGSGFTWLAVPEAT